MKQKRQKYLHVLKWEREVVGPNSTSGARKANTQSYTAGVLYQKKRGRLCTVRGKNDVI